LIISPAITIPIRTIKAIPDPDRVPLSVITAPVNIELKNLSKNGFCCCSNSLIASETHSLSSRGLSVLTLQLFESAHTLFCKVFTQSNHRTSSRNYHRYWNRCRLNRIQSKYFIRILRESRTT